MKGLPASGREKRGNGETEKGRKGEGVKGRQGEGEKRGNKERVRMKRYKTDNPVLFEILP